MGEAETDKWILSDEKLPPCEVWVLIRTAGYREIAKVDREGRWILQGGFVETAPVLAWQYL